MTRALRLLAGLWLAHAAAARGAVEIPAISEPATDNQVISAYDVHMVAGPFVGSPGESHVCSDWEIRTVYSDQIVWSASCVTGVLAVHIHLGDGEFTGLLAGRHELNAGSQYRLRVRFLGNAAPDGTDWSGWAERPFATAAANQVQPLTLSDVASIPAPRWIDGSGASVILPAGSPSPLLRLEVLASGTALEIFRRDDSSNRVDNPPALAAHGPVHVFCASGGVSLALPASRLFYTDGKGEDREIALPPIALAPGESAGFWVDVAGDSFSGVASPPLNATPDFTTQVAAASVPWAIRQPGYVVERFASNLQLPVNLAFVPNPGPNPTDPFFYVSELYGSVRLVTREGAVSEYASGLLNFDPTGSFPGSGEKGLTGIVVEPVSGDVFVSAVEEVPPEVNNHFPRVMRLHSADGGRTAGSPATVLDFPNEPVGPSHQISNLSIGPDGKLYVHIGDGFATAKAQDLTSARGKILRANLDGTAPADNPFFDAADGITATDFVYAYGFRNPFGGAWREADGAHWEVENGPSVDRIAKVVAGRNYLWDGSDASMTSYAAYNWPQTPAPVNIAFVQPGTFGGSGFPAEKSDHAFVTESGATYAPGPVGNGKRISEFAFDAAGVLVLGPLPLVEYIGAGRATATALAAGPDGLYFADLYKDFGAATPIERGANVFRIRYAGLAEFSADATSGEAGMAVAFTDLSAVPAASAWHWEFGDGGVSDERHPVHEFRAPGSFDVRLTVTGSGGAAVREKVGYIVIRAAPRMLPLPARPASQSRELEPRP
jgi:glucose/arabinose dehydrogenase